MLTCGLVIPRSKRINEGILYACALLGSSGLSQALLGSPGLSLVLGDMQVKEMSREIGVSKLIVKCLFSETKTIRILSPKKKLKKKTRKRREKKKEEKMPLLSSTC